MSLDSTKPPVLRMKSTKRSIESPVLKSIQDRACDELASIFVVISDKLIDMSPTSEVKVWIPITKGKQKAHIKAFLEHFNEVTDLNERSLIISKVVEHLKNTASKVDSILKEVKTCYGDISNKSYSSCLLGMGNNSQEYFNSATTSLENMITALETFNKKVKNFEEEINTVEEETNIAPNGSFGIETILSETFESAKTI
ncbi:hypothetical protein H4219_006142, partial [Mycoemilia scoparia]